jgi:hypothetical protein
MKKKNDSNNGACSILAIFLFCWEFLILRLYLGYFINWGLFLFLHALAVIFALFFIYASYKSQNDLRYPLLLFLSLFGTGVFGAAGFILLAILCPLFSLFTTPANIWFEGLFPEQLSTPFSKIFQRVQSRWDDYSQLTEATSFQDLFTFGTLAQKQAVLDAVAKDFNPLYSTILKRALDDPHNAVRIQAAAIVSKIDFDFEGTIIKLTEHAKKTPDDHTILLKLAMQYDNYASLGLLDPFREQEVAERAVNYYREYLKDSPEDTKAQFAIGRLLFYSKDYIKFLKWCEEYRSKFKTLPSIINAWYLEALYKLHRYEELADAARGF